MKNRKAFEAIISRYIQAYNNFDVEGMTLDFDEQIVFEHISNGETTMLLHGLPAFIQQAEQAKSLFSSRQQAVHRFTHHEEKTEVEVSFSAVLATDQPGGFRKGMEIKLTGTSVFTFSGDKIIALTDISH